MIGGRKVRSNKGKRRGSYRRGTGKTRSGAKFRGRNPTVKRRTSNKTKRTRKVRSNKGKKRSTYRRGSGRTRSGRKFRGGAGFSPYNALLLKLKSCGDNMNFVMIEFKDNAADIIRLNERLTLLDAAYKKMHGAAARCW
jgi:hypothetical protein